VRSLKTLLHKKLCGAGKVLILGVGSDLRGDDVAGMLVVETLKKSRSSIKIPLKLISASTAPENFTGEIKRFSPTHIIIIDTADFGKKPGEISFATIQEISGMSFSTHQLPLRIMFDYLQKSLNCEVLVIGIQPQTLEFGKLPSKAVKQAVKSLVAAIREALTSQ
jgi:hydrogenase 3 maturation protease